eukprot:12825-Heterococcus_DN1.PRE.1
MATIAALQTVANDARTAARRQEVTINSELASIDTLISALQQAKTQLRSGSNDASSVQATLSGLRSAVDEAQVVERIAAEHKALHGSISKLCKTAEKVSEQFINTTANVGADLKSLQRTSQVNSEALNTMIASHLYRRGASEAATALVL